MCMKTLTTTAMVSAAIFIAGCTQVNSDYTKSPQAPVSFEDAQQSAASIPDGEADVILDPVEETEVTAGKETTAVITPGTDQSARILEISRPENQLADDEYRWSQLLGRDAILPVYDPEFVTANDAPYDDDELVIGVARDGEAKAYAIGPLNRREMVNDELAGIPILVTW